MKAIVDQDTCTGSGLCPETCPEVFEMDGDVATVKVDVKVDTVISMDKAGKRMETAQWKGASASRRISRSRRLPAHFQDLRSRGWHNGPVIT